MFNKNKQKDYHNALANSFNRKKNKENDAARFRNIHPKINSIIRVDIVENLNTNDIPVTDVYKMDSIQTSVTIPLNMRNNNDSVLIPKVELKEIVIPTYSDNDKYDIATINKNINQTIEMDIYNLDDNFDYDISKLYRKKVQTISNVYQESYTENIKPTGFGDFIRGCYFLLQFCSKYKFKPKIIINHPIAVFLEKFYKKFILLLQVIPLLQVTPLLQVIPMFTENNWKDSRFDTANYIVDTVTDNKTIGDYVNYLCSLKVVNNTVFSYNIMFPYDEICEDHKKYMRDLLQPTEEIQLYVDSTLETLEVYKNCYSVIHIRSGDKYLNDDTKMFDTAYFKKLVYEVNILISYNPDISYLLIADNNEIKLLLVERFPCLKSIFKSITHIGEGTVLEREKVKNTMLDFYLMANANSINSYTCYAHGSGFSYWCATTYNIPQKCMFINIK